MMYFSYEDLVKEYVNRKISVNIKELKKAGLLESFMCDVERLSPTKPPAYNHRTELQVTLTYHDKYFSLLQAEDKKTTYPIASANHIYPVGHLQEDIPSVDMESLLVE